MKVEGGARGKKVSPYRLENSKAPRGGSPVSSAGRKVYGVIHARGVGETRGERV